MIRTYYIHRAYYIHRLIILGEIVLGGQMKQKPAPALNGCCTSDPCLGVV
jgi:hypothetical protein